jgi:uncharacterized protein (DUF697 family)
MRLGAKKSTGGISKFGAAREVISFVRGMSFDEINKQVKDPPRVIFLSADPDAADLLERLTGVTASPATEIVDPSRIPQRLTDYDLILVHEPISNEAFIQARKRAGAQVDRVFDVGSTDAPDWDSQLRTRIAESLGFDSVAIAAWYPAFRDAAATAVINETSKDNAQFALVANVPSLVPIIGSIASAGADMIVLTKNQAQMAIRLAAIYGRPIDDRAAVFQDIAPVIGSGFIWRTLAREGASFLPFAAGTIPKVFVAYAGTFTTGKAIESYFRFGKKPTKDQLKSFYQQALELAKQRIPILNRSDSAPALDRTDTTPISSNGVPKTDA